MSAEATSIPTEETPEPFTVVAVLLADGRLTRAVWTGWDWWGEHRWLPVVRWEADAAVLLNGTAPSSTPSCNLLQGTRAWLR